jgi:hypothetical protein
MTMMSTTMTDGFCFVVQEVAAAHDDADMRLSAEDAIELQLAEWLDVPVLVVWQGGIG